MLSAVFNSKWTGNFFDFPVFVGFSISVILKIAPFEIFGKFSLSIFKSWNPPPMGLLFSMCPACAIAVAPVIAMSMTVVKRVEMGL